MPWFKTDFEGVWVFEPQVFADSRGYFFESFNEAKSSRGVLRGLHYQSGANAQSKLVRVVTGEVLDVIVDIRPGSKTYGKHFSILLNEENKKQLFVPKGFAHGYLVLTDDTIFAYKCDAYYDKANEGGIKYNDPSLGIDWILETEALLLSEKDMELPLLGNHKPFKID